jgi:uncharacterized protein YjbI with pentapeptide repeats
MLHKFWGVNMHIDIKHRVTNVILWSGDAENIKEAVSYAIQNGVILSGAELSGADLTGADLNSANLSGANFSESNLRGAVFSDADLRGADLSGADLSGAYLSSADIDDANLGCANLSCADLVYTHLIGARLSHANLDCANLNGANLEGADLSGANLEGADLSGANLSSANLEGANLSDAYLSGATLHDSNVDRAIGFNNRFHIDPNMPFIRNLAERAVKYRALHPNVPIIEHLDQKILALIEGGATLDMDQWHGIESDWLSDRIPIPPCGTTHCRAGFAVHLGGAKGYALERKIGSAEEAGRAIYLASTGRIPNFFANNKLALADMRRCAEEDANR